MKSMRFDFSSKLLCWSALTFAVTLVSSSHVCAQALQHENATGSEPEQADGVSANATGSGTANKIARWTSQTNLAASIITQLNGKIGIGNANPTALLTVDGKDPAAATVRGTNTSSGNGVTGTSTSGTGVAGTSTSGIGVRGTVTGANNKNAAILGQTSSHAPNASGVTGQVTSNSPGTRSAGVRGINNGAAPFVYGVTGTAEHGSGVRGDGYIGIQGAGKTYGVHGITDENGAIGVYGEAPAAIGVRGEGITGVRGSSPNGGGVVGVSDSGTGVAGESFGGSGVTGQSTNHFGVYGISNSSFAGYFDGKVHVAGTLSKAAGSFEIDHPLDPANKLLAHSFVESPDMMNIYNGNVELDTNGEATVKMPDYFAALNQDYRYQLTAVEAAAPNLHVAQRMKGNEFRIAGGKPGMTVSWMVTGVRHDAYANAHRIAVEKNKSAEQAGRYLHPELFGQPAEQAIGRAPAVLPRDDTAERVAAK